MTFVSVTRARMRRAYPVPVFLALTWASRLQVHRAPGLRSVRLAIGPGPALWTVTLWTDEAAMRAYRRTGAHGRAMPWLRRLCDEAAVTHWTQDGDEPPTLAEAARRLAEAGRLSRVDHPTAAHAAGDAWPDRTVPHAGPSPHTVA